MTVAGTTTFPLVWATLSVWPFRGASREELYERAKQEDIPGRSKMSKEELEQALSSK